MKAKIAVSTLIMTGAIFLACGVYQQDATALNVDNPCSDVQVIFARGSGQDLGKGEYQRFVTAISRRVDSAFINLKDYELGTEKYGAYQYPAVNVSDASNGNAIGAKLSAGMANDYGNSVWQGVNELYLYMQQRSTNCPNTKYILGGYSQGAQVMGQALQDMPQQVRSQIIFVGLFGDPKLHLPEGEGANPPACKGESFSPWRRMVVECATDNGSLSARKPYLPDYAVNLAGLWCNAHDFVCGSSKFVWEQAGHGEYASDNGAIDQAAEEAVERLKMALPGSVANTAILNRTPGSTKFGLDAVFFVDSNVSDPASFDETKAAVLDAVRRVVHSGGRVAITRYGDTEYGAYHGIQWSEARGRYGFVTATSEATTALDQEQAGFFSSGVNFFYYNALAETIDSLDWGKGRMKSIILITQRDVAPSNPMYDEIREYIRKRSLEIDPVNIYPVVPVENGAGAALLAESTGGQVYTFNTATGGLSGAIASATTELIERPVVIFSSDEYIAKPGDVVRFDVSGSYAAGSSIASYDWDFNGDGIWDQQTTLPYVEYVYGSNYQGLVHARAHAANGMVGTMTAPVLISGADARPLITPPVVTGVTVTEDLNSEAAISWQREESTSDQLVSVNGVIIGRLPYDARSVTITDLDRTSDVVVGIRSIDEGGEVSEETGVMLAAVLVDEETTPEVEPPVDAPDPGDNGNTTPAPASDDPAVGRDTKPQETPNGSAVFASTPRSNAADVLVAYNFAEQLVTGPNQEEKPVVPSEENTSDVAKAIDPSKAVDSRAPSSWIAPAVVIAVLSLLAGWVWVWLRKR